MALQERYSNIVEAKLRSTSIFANIVGRVYEGTPTAGAVKVPYRAEATVAAYDPATGLAGTAATTSFKTILIDKDYAVNEIIDGYEAAAVPDQMVAERLDSAGYALGKQADDDIISAINASKTAASTTSTKLVDQIIDTVAEAKALGVDANKIWVAVTPSSYAELIKSVLFTQVTDLNTLQNGQIGRLAGTPIYETNNANFTDKFVVGNSDFIHFVEEFAVAPTVKDAEGNYIGASQVVGRIVYGAAVTDATTVLYK